MKIDFIVSYNCTPDDVYTYVWVASRRNWSGCCALVHFQYETFRRVLFMTKIIIASSTNLIHSSYCLWTLFIRSSLLIWDFFNGQIIFYFQFSCFVCSVNVKANLHLDQCNSLLFVHSSIICTFGLISSSVCLSFRFVWW
jgi:hypothetical protein